MREGTVRLRLRLSGQLQGVGFRPYVFRLAREMGVGGWVRNGSGGVEIELQGPGSMLGVFRRKLLEGLPSLARVTTVEAEEGLPVHREESSFRILPSRKGDGPGAWVPPDAALCPDCLSELFDPGNRRYRYPFIVCTACGPRLTLSRGLPYDRKNTSLSSFPLCPECRREYEDPGDRRFHAEPIACPACGPSLSSPSGDGTLLRGEEALAQAVRGIRAGEIWAIKGVGGFHLVADARNPETVARLRERKRRSAKPFAVMVLNLASARDLVRLSSGEESLLLSLERPIVLASRRPESEILLPGIAPGLGEIGVMLPYAPLHWLLFEGLWQDGPAPPGSPEWREGPCPEVLVMTSANVSGEPLVIDNGQALRTLPGIADGFLLHDREILVRSDDGVVRRGASAPIVVRRSRGSVPVPVILPLAGRGTEPNVLALGASMKNTVCLLTGDRAFFSPHVGDLSNRAACLALEETVGHLRCLLGATFQAVASDAHPDFYSSRLAQRLAEEEGVPWIPVFHHQAHAASVIAEKGVRGPSLAVVFDGFGLGPDGGLWGGELLRMAGSRFERIGHLSPLPGGDRASREPWRVASGFLHRSGRTDELPRRFEGLPWEELIRVMGSSARVFPETTSAGRLFDAAAAILSLSRVSIYEGEAAMRLESAARKAYEEEGGTLLSEGEGLFRLDAEGLLDFGPLLLALLESEDPGKGALLFHRTLIRGVAQWVREASDRTGTREVVLSGGCFLNVLLADGLRDRLSALGFTTHFAGAIPPSDAGIALGQAWVARIRILEED